MTSNIGFSRTPGEGLGAMVDMDLLSEASIAEKLSQEVSGFHLLAKN